MASQQIDEDPNTANIYMNYKWEVLKKIMKKYCIKVGMSKAKICRDEISNLELNLTTLLYNTLC